MTSIEDFIKNIEDIGFIIEDESNIKSLNGGIKKKFTSLAATATLFKWNFGDDTPILETTENPIYHTYQKRGIYNVSHQACIGTCCSGWCTKSLEIEKPEKKLMLAGIGSMFFLLWAKSEECEQQKTKEDCIKHNCEWKEKEKKCVKKIRKEVISRSSRKRRLSKLKK